MGQIVHVDNSSFFRKMMKIFLTGLGHEVESFERGQDAINSIKDKSRIACVITGLELADMTGEDFISRLKYFSQPMAIVAVTSASGEERIKQLEDLGVLAVVKKTGNWKEELHKILT